MRENGTLTWLISDHLGSTSVTADASGNLLSSLRYTAFGELRAASGTTSTDYRYTGQRSEAEIGLYYYVARFYDPYLNHWTQPDTIVPDPYNPQDWDRYSYTRNNPVRYTDPTGHIACDDVDDNGKCINYEQITHRARNNLIDFMQPEQAAINEMKDVGIWPFLDQVSPAEYDLLLNKKGRIDYFKLWKMYQIQQEALNEAAGLFPGMLLWNDRGDAFRHAYWNAQMTKEFGKEFALAFSKAHETGFSLSPNREEVFMDLYNNSVGIDIAISFPNASNVQLQALVMAALNEGRLYVWNGTNIYLSNLVP